MSDCSFLVESESGAVLEDEALVVPCQAMKCIIYQFFVMGCGLVQPASTFFFWCLRRPWLNQYLIGLCQPQMKLLWRTGQPFLSKFTLKMMQIVGSCQVYDYLLKVDNRSSLAMLHLDSLPTTLVVLKWHCSFSITVVPEYATFFFTGVRPHLCIM